MKKRNSNAANNHFCGGFAKPVLGAGDSSSDILSNESKYNGVETQTVNANDILQLIQNAVPSSERMDFTVPFSKYQNVVNALEVCESYIKKMALLSPKQESQ